ncbi:MAG: multicopper oxidase domain-containing protein [Acidimicrobiia bacterium]|nr:multicopper oxidase domain-containing protein [Acidimicrobiia bacterium]
MKDALGAKVIGGLAVMAAFLVVGLVGFVLGNRPEAPNTTDITAAVALEPSPAGISAAAATPVAAVAAQTGAVVEVDLVAEVVDWDVVDGELVEVWGYNGEYPGPAIHANVGDTVRVHLTNLLPEGTSIHFHGLDVPNNQDGVPGITQPMIEPGQAWTYEFVVDEPGTTMYHTHANTMAQLGKGLVGPLIVHDPADAYDNEYVMVLHEIDGFFTINGHSFPDTLNDDTFIQMETGEDILVRFINAGQQHHPMHLHGHQFEVVSLDGNPLPAPYEANTVDIAPGQTVDVVVRGDNPGTWTFHCHIISHVTNKGVYPGGMLTLVDYTDHTSYMEDPSVQPQEPRDAGVAPPPPAVETTASVDASVDGVFEIVATEFAFDVPNIAVAPGDEVLVRLVNNGAVLHNWEIPEWGFVVEAAAGTTAEAVLRVPDDASGEYELLCNIAGHQAAGMEGLLIASG